MFKIPRSLLPSYYSVMLVGLVMNLVKYLYIESSIHILEPSCSMGTSLVNDVEYVHVTRLESQSWEYALSLDSFWYS